MFFKKKFILLGVWFSGVLMYEYLIWCEVPERFQYFLQKIDVSIMMFKEEVVDKEKKQIRSEIQLSPKWLENKRAKFNTSKTWYLLLEEHRK